MNKVLERSKPLAKGAVVAGKVGLAVTKRGLHLANVLKLPWVAFWCVGYFRNRKKYVEAANKKWREVDLSALDSLQLSPKNELDALIAELPRWVFDGDWERASWLNTAIAQLWPGVDEARP